VNAFRPSSKTAVISSKEVKSFERCTVIVWFVTSACPITTTHLEAARSAIREGNFDRAEMELGRISRGQRAEPAVLQADWLVQAAKGNWEECLSIARALTYARPEKSECWIALVKSLMRVGLSDEADSTLARVERSFPVDAAVQELRGKLPQLLPQPRKTSRRARSLRRKF
jgi:Flp pilus assembly protein TadD